MFNESALPLLRFPYVASNEILSHLDIPELISLSLCSKETKNLCSDFRRKEKLKKDVLELKITLSKRAELQIRFLKSIMTFEIGSSQGYPLLDDKPLLGDLFFPFWKPIQKSKSVTEIQSIERSLEILYSKDLISACQVWTTHLYHLFHVSPKSVILDYGEFRKKDIDRIMDFYFSGRFKDSVQKFEVKHETIEKVMIY